MNIFVGNLSYRLSEEELQGVFSEKGEVSSVKIIKDRYTGRSKGFGFVEMPNEEEASKAVQELNGVDVQGRSLRVSKALPPKPRENRSSDR